MIMKGKRFMWKLTGASIPGSDHTMPGKPGWKNNQDAYYLHEDDRMTIGIVADGCGSGNKSEVGAQIGVRLLGELIRESADRSLSASRDTITEWERLRILLLGQLSVLAQAMKGRSFTGIVGDYFLFSILGFIILPKITAIFHCGDGTFVIDEKMTKIGPFVDNAPPYVSYGLLGYEAHPLQVTTFPTDSVTSIAVSTDGVDYIPNFEQVLTGWTGTDALYSNPDLLRRKLALMNLEKVHDGILAPGPLKDDTTLIIARNLT